MSILLEHLVATHARFIAENGKAPGTLALGRWDARELAQAAAALTGGVSSAPRPSQLLRQARGGATIAGTPIKVDGRIGRMPGGLWWHA